MNKINNEQKFDYYYEINNLIKKYDADVVNEYDIEYTKKIMYYALSKKVDNNMRFKNIDDFFNYDGNYIKNSDNHKKMVFNYFRDIFYAIIRLKRFIKDPSIKYFKELQDKFDPDDTVYDIIIDKIEEVDTVYDIIDDMIYDNKHKSYQYETIEKYVKNSLYNYNQKYENIKVNEFLIKTICDMYIMSLCWIYIEICDFIHYVKLNRPKTNKAYVQIDNIYCIYYKNYDSKYHKRIFEESDLSRYDLKNKPFKIFTWSNKYSMILKNINNNKIYSNNIE